MHFKPSHAAAVALSVGHVQANHDISNALAGLASMTSQTSQLLHGISTENAVSSANQLVTTYVDMINGALGSLEGALLKKRDIHAIIPGVALGNGVVAGNANEPILDAGISTGTANDIINTLKGLPVVGGLFASAQSGASPPLLSLTIPSSTVSNVGNTVTKNMGGANDNGVVNTPATNMVNTPATNMVNTPAAGMVNTPATNMANAPATNMANTPAANMANTPATNMVNTPPAANMVNTPPAANMVNTPPAANMANTPPINMANTPGANGSTPATNGVVSAPGTNMVNTPATNMINAPGTNLANTPTGNSIQAPGTNLVNTPTGNGIHAPGVSLGNGINTPVGNLGNLVNPALNGLTGPAGNALAPLLTDLGRTIGELIVGIAGPFFSFVPGLMTAVPTRVTSVVPKTTTTAIHTRFSVPLVDGELGDILNGAITGAENGSETKDSADSICEHFNQFVTAHSNILDGLVSKVDVLKGNAASGAVANVLRSFSTQVRALDSVLSKADPACAKAAKTGVDALHQAALAAAQALAPHM